MSTFARPAPTAYASAGSPQSIGVSSSFTFGPLDLTASSTSASMLLAVRVIIGTAPTTNPTVQMQFSLDGTTYFNDGGPFVVPIVTGNYDYPYSAPAEARYAQAVVTNGTGNAITAFAHAVPLGVS
jgi:hypothetical protein